MLKNKKILRIVMITIGLFMFSTVAAYASDQSVKIDPSKAISVTGGKITGTLSSDKKVAIYKGIPYAAPPVGDLRWKAPQSVIPWSGTKQCTNFSANAMQVKSAPSYCWTEEFGVDNSLGFSEDCLYLNVWTKKGTVKKLRPVIVYIHGGSFNSGGGSCEVYNGEAMAKKDTVYVNINYRVGIFGFLVDPKLSEESPDKVSGNYGIWDMIEALKWVKANIVQFGGNPDNVTIVGQSAGAAAVDVLATSPKAKGLIQNVVSLSFGTMFLGSETLKQREESANVFKDKTLKEMRDIPAQELMTYSNRNGMCIDGVVIPEHPMTAYAKGTANDVNMMSGLVMGDSGDYGFPDVKNITKKQFQTLLERNFGEQSKDIMKLYSVKGDNALSSYNELKRDWMMATQYYLEYVRSLNSKKSTYIYLFNHTMPGKDTYGAFHSSDIAYWLNYFTPLRKAYWKKTDYSIGDMMSSYLVNFAKTGNPNGTKLPKWTVYNKKSITYQLIGNNTSNITLNKKKSDFWKQYFGCM